MNNKSNGKSRIKWKEKLMKRRIHFVVAVIFLIVANGLHAQGTAFVYQGQLQNDGSPANGFYDFQFSLSNALSGGSQVGSPMTILAVGVTNGLFATTLDFGAVFTGSPTWLAISVRSNATGSYVGLTPLQPLTPTTYSIFANTASNLSGELPAAQLSGTLPLAQLPAPVVTNSQTGVTLSGTFSGTFAGSGTGLTSLNPGNLGAGTAAINISGNAATATSATAALTATTANSFSGSLAGDVTGTQSATAVSTVGGQTAANVASGATAANAATSVNTPKTIVQRDASGNFSAGTITANLVGNATTATTSGSANSVAATNLTGTILNSSFPASPGFSGTVTASSFVGNGGGLTNVTAATLAIPSGMALIPAGSFTMGDTLDGESDAIPSSCDGVGVLHGHEPGELQSMAVGLLLGRRTTAMALTMPVRARRRIIRCRRWIGMTV